MNEYISKHEAYTMLKDLEAAYIYPPVKEAYGTAARRIDQIPAADVQPVHHIASLYRENEATKQLLKKVINFMENLIDNGSCHVTLTCEECELCEWWNKAEALALIGEGGDTK